MLHPFEPQSRSTHFSPRVVPRGPSPVRHRAVLATAMVWFGLTTCGLFALSQFAATPGAKLPRQIAWPAEVRLVPDPYRHNLVLFLHPRCSCSRATVDELAEVLATCPDRVTLHVLFYKPAGAPENWENTDTWQRINDFPRAQRYLDLDGQLAPQFDGRTSGKVMLYDPTGRLLFHGGITRARGHAGDNPGRRSIVSLLTGVDPELTSSPVFGCPLIESEENPPEGPVP